MFKYEYVEEGDIKKDYVFLTPGKCKFEIIDCYEKDKYERPYTYNDKNGKQHSALMIKLIVTDSLGRKETVYDYISHWKLRPLMTACGLLHAYTKGGILNLDILKKQKGKCIIDHEEKPSHKKKNVVKEYLKNEEEFFAFEKASQEQLQSTIDDDDVPF